MKFVDKYFVPYAEYTLRTMFSEEELKAAFEEEFPMEIDIFSKKTWKAIFGNQIVFRRNMRSPFILFPVMRQRNSARGKLFIRCEKAEYSTYTILHITIAPANTRWLVYSMLCFIILWGIAAVCAKFWWGLLISMVFVGGLFWVLECCRSMAADEVPKIRRAFEHTLQTMEHKYHTRGNNYA